MSISAISSSTTDSSLLQSLQKQIQQDLKQLQSALKSNDLSGAQSAFSALEKLLPGNSTASGSSASGASASDSTALTAKNDIDAIGKALSSGDLTGAQQAFSNLQSLGQPSAPSGYGSTNGNSSADPITNDFNNLSSALQSGDLKSAQAAFKQLQSDLSSGDSTDVTAQTGYGGHYGVNSTAGADQSSTQAATSTFNLVA
jgi:TolA-binding protein